MNQLSDHTRRIGGLLLEVLVLVFVFSGSFIDIELFDNDKGSLTVRASPVEQIAYRDPNSSSKLLSEFHGKVQNPHGHFTPFIIDFANQEIVNASRFLISLSLYNIFYTHLTSQAP
jgi:hypothetical protein